MEPCNGYGCDIRVPPPFEKEELGQWKSRMETFLMMVDFDQWSALTEGFDAPVDKKGKPLKKSKWTEEQIQKSEISDKVIRLLVSLIPNNILVNLGEYKDACELWSKLDKHHEEPTTLSSEDKSTKQEVSSTQELESPEVERCSTSESDSEEYFISEDEEETSETSTSRIEGEERQVSLPEQEEASTSGRNEEEFYSCSSTSPLGNSSTLISSKDHIICFECRKLGHYKSKCPKRAKKIPVASKAKEVNPLVRKGKEHIRCFQCNQQGHYRNQCPRGRHPRKDKGESSKSGGALQSKQKVSPLFSAISKINNKMHARSYIAIVNKSQKHANCNNKFHCLGAKHVNLPKDKPRTTSSKDRKSDNNLGKNPNSSRHMPKKKKNFQGINGQSKFEELQVENQVLRSRLDQLEKTLKKMKNTLNGSNDHKLGLDRRQGYPKDNKGLGHKPKSKNDKPSYHCVSYDYGTKPRSRSVKVTREEIPRVNLNKTQMTKASNKSKKVIRKVTREVIPRVDQNESTMTKASKKPRKVIRMVSREVIPSEYLINPRSSNRFWVPRSVIPSH